MLTLDYSCWNQIIKNYVLNLVFLKYRKKSRSLKIFVLPND